MKLSDVMHSKDNNFTLLRLMAATFVLVHHMFALLGESHREEGVVGAVLGQAVPIFIVISGFLVTKSWVGDPRLLPFVKKRALRIYPALICAVLFAAFIIGPLITHADLAHYFSHPLTAAYLKNVFLFPVYYYLPGVFMSNPYPHAVNGSLWTLPIEVFLYGVLIVLGLTSILKRRVLVAVLTGLLIAGEQYYKPVLSAGGGFFLTMPLKFLVSLGILFLLGALCFLYAEKVVLNKWIALALLPLFVLADRLPLADLIRYASLPYLVLTFTYTDLPAIKFFQQTDVSYGVYVYAFPIQQTVVHYLYGALGTYTILMLCLAIVVMISYLSWHFVEKPSLAWAHKPSFREGGNNIGMLKTSLKPSGKSMANDRKKKHKRKTGDKY